ncbi:MAG: single-stranded-DNA-specific exonuclease RecJ [Bacteroidetes bacterium]|nr:single-stranded-DNA-specific exonuclease RecJ [Bacteroidota bacterium]
MRWKINPLPDQKIVTALQETLKIDAILATLLAQRGITDFAEAEKFFRPSSHHLHDPYLMKDMQKAVARISTALEKGERILVYGDYDVDGTTSVALMASYLGNFTTNLSTYIPDRYQEGYGVSYEGIDFADNNDFSLIIALDCGIKAVDKVAYALEKGIDFIICDHHTPGEQVPDAYAILNPKQKDCSYPYKELCGCGVGFKLIQALHLHKKHVFEDLIPYLDLVAVAIGADIVPMTGENRVLMHLGLSVLNTKPRPGFQQILAQLKKKTFDVYDVVFVIAPRINAAGRMKHGSYAVQLLMENDTEQAKQQCAAIETYNKDRKETDANITEEALLQIEKNGETQHKTTVVYQENWHKGVIGIVASRLTEHYYRPTVVFTKSGEKLAASARSVSGFDLYEALECCAEHIEQFGGHKYAAGLTLLPEKYQAFKDTFEKVVTESILPELLEPSLKIDLEITLGDISEKFYRILQQMAPFGPGNMSPVFVARQVRDTGYAKAIGKENDHLRLTLTQNGSAPIASVGFGFGHLAEQIKHRAFDVVFSLDKNVWNGQESLQLKIKDIRVV